MQKNMFILCLFTKVCVKSLFIDQFSKLNVLQINHDREPSLIQDILAMFLTIIKVNPA